MSETMPDVDGEARDTIVPEGSWEFNENVAAVFDDMLIRSIPQYDVMREAVVDVVDTFTTHLPKMTVLDIGTSSGAQIQRLSTRIGTRARFIGTDVSIPMLNQARTRFIGDDETRVRFERHDLREGFPDGRFDAILSVLTLQFVPIEYRERIVRQTFDHLNPGGIFVVVEKVLGRNAIIDDAMTAIYYNRKRANGYTDEQIDRKRLSLEGVLVPITAQWNEQMLYDAGFTPVDCFWRWMTFAGWVAIKPSTP